MRISAAIAVTLLVGGCASTVYKDEATQLGVSASALATAFPSQSAVDAEGAGVLDIDTDLVMLGAPVRYQADCGDNAFAAYKSFLESLDQAQSVQDQAFETLTKSPGCRDALAPPPASPDASAGAKPAGKVDPALEARLKRDEARQAAVEARSHSGDRTGPAPVCKGSCSLEDYTRQIKAYGDAIKTASAAQNVTDAQKAVGSADSAIDGLLKAAKAPSLAAPIVDVVAAIGKLALQQAQYAAMKHAVLAFDQAWPSVAPAVEAAARLRQAELISYRADTSQGVALAAQQYVNDDHYYSTPTERLQLYDALESKVDAAAASLKKAQVDPGAAIAAFSRANHTLALAMEDPKRQSTTLTADLKAVEEQVTAIQKAAGPAKSGA